MTVESDGQGGIKVVQGAGVGAKADQQQKAVDSKIDKAMALTQDLNLLESRTQSMAPGVSGAVGRIVAEQIPATPQAENKEIIDRVIATLTLENLQAMRNNNPTGASLGNVSDKDTGLLRSSATALNNAQSPESFKRELVRLKNLQHDVIYGSERVLKQKLDKGEITKSQFDEAMANSPSEYLDDRGAVRTRKPIVSTLGTGSGSNDIYKEFGIE
jgi:dGTP triphosphohydrolase